jgi:hypothetical protein
MNAQTGNIVAYVPVNYALLHVSAGHARPQKYIALETIRKYRALNKQPEKTPEGKIIEEKE